MTADVELLEILRDIAAGRRNSAGDYWSRDYCDKAAAKIEALQMEIEALRAEVERLTGCLATANANHEQFERQWYLELDRAERLAEALREAAARRTGGWP